MGLFVMEYFQVPTAMLIGIAVSTAPPFPMSFRSMLKQRSSSVLVFLLVFFILSLFQDFRSQAQVLPDDEVGTLQQIFTRLNNDYWSSNVDPYSCVTGKGLQIINRNTSLSPDNRPSTNITCDCTFNRSTICHVTFIQLRRLNINGELPIDFASLAHLRGIDLTRNYFKGSIPREWASLPLVSLSLLGNLVGGTIPREIGNIRTLVELILQDNNMGGPLPPELGNLVNLRRLLLGGNNYTGVLPDTFGNLKNLTDFRIDGTSLSGKIPEFIGNWTELDRLDMQGTSMEGPIPSTISLLTDLTGLRITDLNASNIPFPDLRNLIKLEELVLRNCSIAGPIPSYIGQSLTNIRTLDLSFNRLNGTLPDNWDSLRNLEFMYLTSNSLTGQVSKWLSNALGKYDISYNNFTGSLESDSCQATNLKKIAIYSSLEDKSIDWCLKKDLPCPKKSSQYELFINCGGPSLSNEGKQYESDVGVMGPSSFTSNEKWACSTTGNFLGNEKGSYNAISRSDENIYSSARLAPFSLRYYGLCLLKGSYTVKLHFTEIMLTADPTNNARGWGRRIFDVYIQGDRVLSDFNIAEEAGGIGKGIVKEYKANVTGSTLEIHLYWSGKGTTALPEWGVYGPLISAISVTPYADPPTKISAGTIAGIVVATLVVVVLIILAVLWKKGCLEGKVLEDKGDIPTGAKRQTNVKVLLESCKFLALQRYKYSDIKAMTKSFEHILGQGGYGRVYKGTLRNDGRLVAIKVLNESKGNGEEFINEVATIGRTNHVNVVSLLGFCIEGTKRALVYEFLPNGSLERYIYNEKTSSSGSTHLGWEKLYQIALGIARGLEYLHCRCNTRILHFDIKPHNILLDQDFLPKISDFGLAKLCPTKESIVSMVGARGTMGYIAPELSCRNLGGVSHKSDVYSYGMMVLEMIGGRKNLDITVENISGIYFPHWIYNQLKRDFRVEEPEEIKVEGAEEILKDETAKKMIIVALWCIQTHPANRPSMTKVVEMLEESNEQLQMPPNPSLDPLPLS